MTRGRPKGSGKGKKSRSDNTLSSDANRVANFFFPKSSDWPRPQITLRRSLIDKTTPTTPSRQSLIDKPRFGAIPSKCMRIDEFVCTMAANINESGL